MPARAPLPWNQWLKELRAELGRKEGRKKITQGELAHRVGKDQSTIGRLEMTKKSEHAREQPERDTYVKLMELASSELRSRARQVVDLPEMSDPSPRMPAEQNAGAYRVQTTEGTFVAKRLDAVLKALDDRQRYRLMQDCLSLIDKAEAHHPSRRAAE